MRLCQAQEAEEDEPQLPHPGIRAEYFVGEAKSPAVVRPEALPAIWLSAGEAPDSRLPADGWTARWQGVLDIQQPGKYRLAASASGKLKVAVLGQVALDFKGSGAPKKDDPFEAACAARAVDVVAGE